MASGRRRSVTDMARILREDAERFLMDVPQDNVFWCQDGCVMKNMRQLRDALAGMSDETFSRHVSESNNDFTNWVRDVIKDGTLARQIARSRDRAGTARVVAGRVDFLSAKLG